MRFHNAHVFHQCALDASVGQARNDCKLQAAHHHVIDRCNKNLAVGIAFDQFKSRKVGAGLILRNALSFAALLIIPKHVNDSRNVSGICGSLYHNA